MTILAEHKVAAEHLRGVEGATILNTPGLREIRSNISQLQDKGGIILIDGKPGVGKTFGTRQTLSNCNLDIYWTDMPDTPKGKEAMARIFHSVTGKHPTMRMTNYELTEATIEALDKKQGILVIDEAQNLTHSALRALRFLHDRPSTQMLFILVGSNVIGTVRNVPELDSRVSRRSIIHELTSKDLLLSLKELHPIFAATKEEIMVDLGEYARGNLRSWARILEVAETFDFEEILGINQQQCKYIIRTITGGKR